MPRCIHGDNRDQCPHCTPWDPRPTDPRAAILLCAEHAEATLELFKEVDSKDISKRGWLSIQDSLREIAAVARGALAACLVVALAGCLLDPERQPDRVIDMDCPSSPAYVDTAGVPHFSCALSLDTSRVRP